MITGQTNPTERFDRWLLSEIFQHLAHALYFQAALLSLHKRSKFFAIRTSMHLIFANHWKRKWAEFDDDIKAFRPVGCVSGCCMGIMIP